VLFPHALGFSLGGFELFAKSFERLFTIGALGVFLLDELLVAARFLMRPFFLALQALQFLTGKLPIRELALLISSAARRCFMIEGNGVFLALLLQLPQTFQIRFESRSLVLQDFLFGGLRGEQALLLFELRLVVAQFTLQDEGPEDFLRTGQHPAVVAFAIREQEVAGGMCVRHGTRLFAIGSEVAVSQAREVAGLACEAVAKGYEFGQPWQIQSRGDIGETACSNSTRNVARPSSSDRSRFMLCSAWFHSFTTTYSSSSVRNSSTAFLRFVEVRPQMERAVEEFLTG